MATKSKKRKQERRRASARARAEKELSGFDSGVLELPDGVKVFQVKKAGVYRLDIIPYVVGEGNPNAEEGEEFYERTFYTHRNVGPEDKPCICLQKTFGEKCKPCATRSKLQRDPDADKESIKALNYSRRQLFNVIDLDNREAGIQLFPYSHFAFGKLIDTKVLNGDDGEYDNFWYYDEGMSLKVTFTEEPMGEGSYFKATDIEFKPRKKQYAESIVEKAHCLDELIKHPTSKSIRELFLQTGDDDDDTDEDEEEDDTDEDDDEDDRPSRKSKKSPAKKSKRQDDDEDEDTEDEDDDEESDDEEADDSDEDDDDEAPESPAEKGEWVSFKYKGRKIIGEVVKVDVQHELVRVKAKDRSEPYNLAFDDDMDTLTKAQAKKLLAKAAEADEDDDEDEDDEPPVKSKKKSKKPAKEEDEDDDDIPFDDEDDDDEDDDPPPKKSKKKSSKK